MALAVVAVVVLVWLVSARVRLPAAPGTLIGVLVALILASALHGGAGSGCRGTLRLSVTATVSAKQQRPAGRHH